MLGFAFKADTGDTRESAAITLVRNFFAERALVQIYDPQVEHNQIWMDLAEAMPSSPLDASVLPFHLFHPLTVRLQQQPPVKKQVTICASALDACKNAEAVVIATEWKEFRDIPWEEVYLTMSKPAFVFDGRLLVDADALRKIGFKVRLILSRSCVAGPLTCFRSIGNDDWAWGEDLRCCKRRTYPSDFLGHHLQCIVRQLCCREA